MLNFKAALDDEEFSLDLNSDIPVADKVESIPVSAQPSTEKMDSYITISGDCSVSNTVVAAISAPSDLSISEAISVSNDASSLASTNKVDLTNTNNGEDALLKRVARFGVATPAVAAKLEANKKVLRAERFGLPAPVNPASTANNVQPTETAPATKALGDISDPEIAAKILARANRFGVISKQLQKEMESKSESEEVKLKKKSILDILYLCLIIVVM